MSLELNDDELLRYSRQILLPQIDVAGQLRLKQSRVLIAQCAGKRHAGERRGAGAVNLAGGADVGQTGARNVEQPQQWRCWYRAERAH